MPDLDAQLHDYFEATTPAVEMDEIVRRSERVARAPVEVRSTRRPVPGWAIAALAVAVVVAAVGGAAWLLNADGSDVGPAQTIPGIPSTLVTSSISTAPEGSAVARGSGPEISWMRVSGAPAMRGVVWFGDAFFGIGRTPGGPALYRSSDGTAWETVEGFAETVTSGSMPDPSWLVAGSANLIALLSAAPELAIDVATSQDGTEWNVTRIEIGLPDPLPTAAAGVAVWPGPTAAGPAGFLVSATVEGTPDYEGLIASVYGWEIANDLSSLQVSGNRILFSTNSGSDYQFSLSDLGLTAADLTVEGTGARAWWSPDGVNWRSAVREGPLLSPGFGSIVPVADGFLVARIGVGLWKTTDGSSWEEIDPMFSDRAIFDWNGTPVELQPNRGIFRTLGSSEPLPFSDAIGGGLIDLVSVGEAGFLTALGQFSAPTQQGEAPVPTLVYSPDGTEWRSWVIEEIMGEQGFVTELTVGSHRLLALTADMEGQPQLWVGVPEG